MIGESRPLRFVMVIVGGWTGMRVSLLWPAHGPVPPVIAAPLKAATDRIAALETPGIVTPVAAFAATAHGVRSAGSAPRFPVYLPAAPAGDAAATPPPPAPAMLAPAQASIPIGAPLPAASPHGEARPSRLGGSFWLIARGDGPAVPFAPQLGGSQAGLRLTYALGDSRRVAVAARFSSALATKQREAAVGLD
ncbi:MAG: hypothetical protein QM688_15330, partial [Sphingomonas bacterium]